MPLVAGLLTALLTGLLTGLLTTAVSGIKRLAGLLAADGGGAIGAVAAEGAATAAGWTTAEACSGWGGAWIGW